MTKSQVVDVEGVSLTAVIQGSRARPTVFVEDTYEIEIPDHMLEQLDVTKREMLLLALDRKLPVCCIAVIESDGSKLYELRHLLFPQETREALLHTKQKP